MAAQWQAGGQLTRGAGGLVSLVVLIAHAVPVAVRVLGLGVDGGGPWPAAAPIAPPPAPPHRPLGGRLCPLSLPLDLSLSLHGNQTGRVLPHHAVL